MRQLEKVVWAAKVWIIGSTSGIDAGRPGNCRNLIKIPTGGLK